MEFEIFICNNSFLRNTGETNKWARQNENTEKHQQPSIHFYAMEKMLKPDTGFFKPTLTFR